MIEHTPSRIGAGRPYKWVIGSDFLSFLITLSLSILFFSQPFSLNVLRRASVVRCGGQPSTWRRRRRKASFFLVFSVTTPIFLPLFNFKSSNPQKYYPKPLDLKKKKLIPLVKKKESDLRPGVDVELRPR